MTLYINELQFENILYLKKQSPERNHLKLSYDKKKCKKEIFVFLCIKVKMQQL